MLEKPATRAGYEPEFIRLVRAGCLTFAVEHPELARESVVIGGSVPSLLIDPGRLPARSARHVGTRDLDLGLSMIVRRPVNGAAIERRLRELRFEPDLSAKQQPTRERWIRRRTDRAVTVDFLIAPEPERGERGGHQVLLTPTLAATVTPALELAIQDLVVVELTGETLDGRPCTAQVRCCGPGAFMVLKTLAFLRRETEHERNKDAYDLDFVLRHFGAGPADVAARLRPLLHHPEARLAREALAAEFSSNGARGPQRLARFLDRLGDDELLADSVGLVAALLRALGQPGADQAGSVSESVREPS